MVETGLVTAPVTLPGWPPAKMAKLARELVLLQKPREAILADYRIDEATFKQIAENDFYKRAFEAYCIEWNSAVNTPDRLQIQSLTILEDGLPHLGAKMQDDKEPLSSKVQVATLLSKMGGISEGRRENAAGEKFTITINLGGDVQTYEKVLGEAKPIVDAEFAVLEKPDANDTPESSVP